MKNDDRPKTADFQILVAERLDVLDKQNAPFTDPRSALDELQRRLTRMRAAINESDHLEIHRQLVTLLAHGCRMARDLSLDAEAAAVLLDDAELDRR